jgi:hypothetical protein
MTSSQTVDAGSILKHRDSGKLYEATGRTGATGKLEVYGLRNGKNFGPVRYVDSEKLMEVEAEV